LALPGEKIAGQVNVLAGSHLTPGDIEEIREIVEAFGLTPIILPDLSGSLDGHVPDNFSRLRSAAPHWPTCAARAAPNHAGHRRAHARGRADLAG